MTNYVQKYVKLNIAHLIENHLKQIHHLLTDLLCHRENMCLLINPSLSNNNFVKINKIVYSSINITICLFVYYYNLPTRILL